MPRPTSATALARPDLGQAAYEYFLAAQTSGFVAQQIMPIFETPFLTAEYPVIPIEAIMKLSDTSRAPRANYQRDDWEFEVATYTCKENGWEEPIDDVEARLYKYYFDAEVVAAERATQKLLRGYEKRVVDKVTSTANITNNATAAVAWSTIASCTPLADVEAGREAMRMDSGLLPNVVVMNDKVFNYVRRCTEIQDRVKYTNQLLLEPMSVQLSAFAQYFDVERIILANAMYDTTGRGKSKTLGRIWPDSKVLLASVSKAGESLKVPTLGRTFLWTEDSPTIMTAESYREEAVRGNIYRVRHYCDECFTFAAAGYLITSVA